MYNDLQGEGDLPFNLKDMRFVRKIILDPLPKKVQVSKKRNKQYWKKTDKLTLTMERHLKKNLIFLHRDGYYRDSISKTKIWKNTKSAGTPGYLSINAQHIYNSNMSQIMRSSYIKRIKSVIRPFLVGIQPVDISDFPVQLTGKLYCPSGAANWDLDNLAYIYSKVIQDLLVELRIIPDDSIRYINKSMDLRHEEHENDILVVWITTENPDKNENR
jgi:hypothetical protein